MVGETIFALSSGSLPSGVAIIRVSGPQAFKTVSVLAGVVPRHRQATLRILRKPGTDEHLDEALVLAFKGPKSFTGEDVVEFQCHGGRATVAAVLDSLSGFDNCRLAEAGEFSRRAFQNGRMDLTELEGLADLVAAETEQQRRLALDQSSGSLRTLYEGWRADIINVRAMLEADFDFNDEDDVPGSVAETVWPKVEALRAAITDHVSEFHRGETIRDGFRVVLTGPPNAGKSTLFNGLLKRNAAIVTDVAGTTRDVLEARLDIDGYLVRLFDTAGIRETSDVVEQAGIERARDVIASADLILSLSAGHTEAVSDASIAHIRSHTVLTHSMDNKTVGTTSEIDATSRDGIRTVEAVIAECLR